MARVDHGFTDMAGLTSNENTYILLQLSPVGRKVYH